MKQAIVYHNKKKIATAKLCDTSLSRTIGLMLSRPKAAVLKADNESIHGTSIHTFFMRFALDLLWLDKDMNLVDFKKNVRPYRLMVMPKSKAMYVIELPTDKNLKLKARDKIKLTFLTESFL